MTARKVRISHRPPIDRRQMPGPRPEFLPGIPYRCFVQTTVVFSFVVKLARNSVFARCIETPDFLIWPKNWVVDPTLRTILGCYDHSGRLEVRTSDQSASIQSPFWTLTPRAGWRWPGPAMPCQVAPATRCKLGIPPMLQTDPLVWRRQRRGAYPWSGHHPHPTMPR